MISYPTVRFTYKNQTFFTVKPGDTRTNHDFQEKQMEAFWREVDEHAQYLDRFQEESSFKLFMESIHEKCDFIQGVMRRGGMEHTRVRVNIPRKFFYTLVSSFKIDRASNATCRYFFFLSCVASTSYFYFKIS